MNIVVVDDASTDDTGEAIREQFPDVHVVRLERNSGFCAAVNAGVRASPCELVFLLNNDMTLEPSCIERLVAALDSGQADMAAPLVLFRDTPDIVYSAGDRILRNGRPESFGHGVSRKSFAPPRSVFGVSGGAGLIRREIFDRVGLLDERYGAYFEDADLAFRARLAGYRATFVQDAIAYHVGSATIRDRLWWRSQQCCRNHAMLVIKNMPARLLWRYSPRIALESIHQMRQLVSRARTEFGLLRALGMLARTELSVGRMLPHLMRERRAIQRTRQLSDAELDALLAG
jgi:hypothetical protein